MFIARRFLFSTTRQKKNILSITDNAAMRVKQLLANSNDPNIIIHQIGVKLGVKTRGCNGLSYTMNYCDKIEKLDEVVEDKESNQIPKIGVRVIVENKAVMILIGTEMDYVEDDIKSEFVFRNPNEKVETDIIQILNKGQCGCGESFHI